MHSIFTVLIYHQLLSVFSCLYIVQSDIMEADPPTLSTRVYNVTAISFTPAQLAASIQKVMPDFKIDYKPDFRQVFYHKNTSLLFTNRLQSMMSYLQFCDFKLCMFC